MADEPAERTFPIVRVASGDAFERGRLLGEALKDRIRVSIEGHSETFAHYTRKSWGQIRELASEFAAPIATYDPEILLEMKGIAAGSGRKLGDILALNCRNEIMFGVGAITPPECTTFYAGPTATADEHVLLGQNWDWRMRAVETTTVIEIDQGPLRPSFVMLPEAGLVGKMGFNEHGLGVVLNMLVTDLDVGERAVPIHVVLRGILNSRTCEEALAAIVRQRRGASATYTIAAADGTAIAVEAGPGGVETVFVLHPRDGILTHSNHFVGDTGFVDVGRTRWPDSLERIGAMREHLDAHDAITTDHIKSALRDETGGPGAICRSPNPHDHYVEASATVASVIIDLTRLRMEVAYGRPSENDYREHQPAFADAVSAR